VQQKDRYYYPDNRKGAALSKISHSIPASCVLSERNKLEWFGRYMPKFLSLHHSAREGRLKSDKRKMGKAFKEGRFHG